MFVKQIKNIIRVCGILLILIIFLSSCTGKKSDSINTQKKGTSTDSPNESNPKEISKEFYPIKTLNNTEEITYINNDDISGIGDPYAFTYDNKYYVTATSNGKVFELFRSEDMKKWSFVRKIFETSYTKGWVRANLWQPQLVIGKDGKFYLYFCGDNENGSLRIGVAVAESAEGPFIDERKEPLFDLGYATIDPNLFIDEDGKMYLYYSKDCSENIVDNMNTSQIYVVEMESYTEVRKGAEHKLLLTPEQDWELMSGSWRWNEGPDLLKHDNRYYLFYSANCYADAAYSIGYAVSDNPLGPFEKYSYNPVLSASGEMSGTGNNSFLHTLDGKELFMVYHTHTIPIIGGGDRKLTIDRCGFREDGTFYVNGPTQTRQPEPSGKISLVNTIEAVTASSCAEGKNVNLTVDGAISKNENDIPYEWTTKAGDKENYIEVTFKEETDLKEIVLYRCLDKKNVPQTIKIIIDNGIIENITLPEQVLEPIILNFNPVKTKHVKIVADNMGEAESFGLAEIMFFN